MSIIPPTLEKNIDAISKIATISSKFGVIIGSICVIIYSLRINHFPQDLSLGDGLLFIMTAACFGIVYIFFTISLLSLGITISPIIKFIIKLIIKGINLLKKQKSELAHALAPFRWLAVIFGLFAIYLILILGNKDPTAYWTLPLISLGLYLFYSIYTSSGSKIKKINNIRNSLVHTKEKENSTHFHDIEKLQSQQIFSLVSILAIPLLSSGVSGQLLDAAMQMAHIRIEKAIIHIKEPYSELLPKALVSKDQNISKDYTKFNEVKILFNGFGKTTVISFTDAGETRRLEIPNESIIIEDR